MTHHEIILLIRDVRELQRKYYATGNGLVRAQLKKKEAILDNVIAQELKPRNPQQELFEAQ